MLRLNFCLITATAIAFSLSIFTQTLNAKEISVMTDRGTLTVHVPNAHKPGSDVPLVMLLHGLGADGERQEGGGSIDVFPQWTATGMHFLKHVETKHFMLVYPNGTVQEGIPPHRFWNATDACCNLFGSGVDDGKFLNDLVDRIYAHDDVKSKRSDVYIVGHSNGGFMAHAMACRFGSEIKAIVSVAGATFLRNSDCLASVESAGSKISPTHILQIHSKADSVIAYGGGSMLGPILSAPAPYPGARTTVQNWGNLLKDIGACTGLHHPPINRTDLDLVEETNQTTVYNFGCSDASASIELWALDGVPTCSKVLERIQRNNNRLSVRSEVSLVKGWN